MFLIYECDVFMCAKHMNLALICIRLMMTLHSLSLKCIDVMVSFISSIYTYSCYAIATFSMVIFFSE